MSSVYPGAYDEFDSPVNQPGTEFPNGPATSIWAEHFTQRSDALAALEATLGLDPQATYGTVQEFLADLLSRVIALESGTPTNTDHAIVTESNEEIVTETGAVLVYV